MDNNYLVIELRVVQFWFEIIRCALVRLQSTCMV